MLSAPRAGLGSDGKRRVVNTKNLEAFLTLFVKGRLERVRRK